MNPTEILGLRKGLGLSQRAMADKLGVSILSVHRWESGKHAPRGLSLRALLKAARDRAREDLASARA